MTGAGRPGSRRVALRSAGGDAAAHFQEAVTGIRSRRRHRNRRQAVDVAGGAGDA
ncbi:hypothetical protein GCM10027073_07680 [Streptomyces chlorus]